MQPHAQSLSVQWGEKWKGKTEKTEKTEWIEIRQFNR